jgi:amidase
MMTGSSACSAPARRWAPAGWSKRLPIGLQIVGRRFRDDTVLGIGKALEQALPWAGKRPPV